MHTFNTPEQAKEFDQKVHSIVGSNLHLLPIVLADIDREQADDSVDAEMFKRHGHRRERRIRVNE